jgi:pimeloyl-ACP methyl ester carboxylesterase
MTFKTLTATGAVALMMVLPALAAQDAHAARVSVPVDRANPSAGRLSLYVERTAAAGPRRRTLLYLAGGPGSAATTEASDVVALLGRRFRRSTELVAFDARGTGHSGVFVCPALQRDRSLRSTTRAASCAARLGARRGTTTVAEQVEDVESVRRALRIARWDLLGISYGTEVAQRYAQRYPGRVGRVVLDSVLPPEGPSALSLEVFAGMPRVLHGLCARKRCAAGVPDPAAEVPALVRRLRAARLRAPVFDARGRGRAQELGPVALWDLLLAGDFNPAVRLALPGAIAAARGGDAAALLRLAALDRAANPLPDVAAFSNGMYAATSCESLPLPWDGAADRARRRAQAAARIAELGDAPFAPFDGRTVLDGDFLPLCLGWPAPAHRRVDPPREVPAVPELLLSGEEDLRTPVESARDAAARNPRARLVTVGGVGHSVMTSDDTGCAARAARRFLARASTRTTHCRGPEPYLPPVPPPPTGVDALGAGRTAAQRVRRTLRAIDATLDDVVLAITAGSERGGGLRGGSYRVSGSGVALRAYEYVPGVRLDATPLAHRAARVRVRGAGVAAGTVTLRRSGRVAGTLGGRRVRGKLPAGPPSY